MAFYSRRTNGGFLIVMLLLVIVGGMLIYFNMAGGSVSSNNNSLNDQQADQGEYCPWDYLGSLESGLECPVNESQFDLENGRDASLTVYDKATNKSRGKISLSFSPDGYVTAYWSGNYKKADKIEYDIFSAGGRGNVDPSVVYVSDLDGSEDESLMYFITQGNFTMIRSEGGKVTKPAGELFVTGFLRSNGAVFGSVHLTSNRESQTVFHFGKEFYDN